MFIVQVAIPISTISVFNYKFNLSLPLPNKGCRVLVPFGNRIIIGIVLSHNQNININHKQLKIIKQILDKNSLFTSSLWSLLLWSSKYYHHPIGKILFYVLPVLLRKGKLVKFSPILQWHVTQQGKKFILEKLKNSPKQQRALALLQKKSIYCHQIMQYKLSKYVLQNLKNKLLIQLSPTQPKVEDWHINFHICGIKPKLNLEQSIAVKEINSKLTFIPWLLVGINGSDKTEVYLNVIENILLQGKQILVLVPEINLITQITKIFIKRFNIPIDILHSALNNNKKLDIWLRAKTGKNAIIIGTRSALFTSFNNLGLIIIDEEHDNSYKQSYGWCYHARDLAVLLAKKNNIPIILGTETPSIESLYNIKRGKYYRLDLNKRTGNVKLVNQYLIDLKGQSLTHGISKPLIKYIKKHLTNNNQVMLFLNRRGYSPILICHDCSWIFECLRCNHYYTLHNNKHKLCCHQCNNQQSIPIQCLHCGSTYLLPIGLGTEQLEEAIKKIFPNIPVTRIDKDTTRSKGLLEKQLKIIYTGGARVLIGTQMLAKGHYFPDVTLIALINIDGVFFSSDYRATEKFAQFYIQISRRIGRSGKNGEIILQTHYPDHPLLSTLLQKGYNAFAIEILEERCDVFLPPYSSHVLINSEDYNNQSALNFLNKLRKYIEQYCICSSQLLLIGPKPAIKVKIAGRFRWNLLFQHPSRLYLQQFLSYLIPTIIKYPESKKVKWSINVDPIEN
ncbi:MAG: primosomal protein N' [Arsenophonus endosymbiont of Ceratovacuna japonica]